MTTQLYSVEQVAELLGLHVRTVRGYIRAGRLQATRIGKQYRISRADLETFTGHSVPASDQHDRGAAMEVSSIVHLNGIDRANADRLSTLISAGANTNRDPAHALRIQTSHDEERNRMTIVILGGAAATADLLRLLHDVLDSDNGLLGANGLPSDNSPFGKGTGHA